MSKVSRAAILCLICGTCVLSLTAATITSVSVTGSPADPTITITGTGFDPVPPSTSLANNPPYTGLDYGADLYFIDTSNTAPFQTFAAGYDFGAIHNIVGLSDVSYSDSLISFQLGSEYSTYFYPLQIFGVNAGDSLEVFVHGASFTSTVPAAAPEPSSVVLLASGGLLLLASQRYSRRRKKLNSQV